MEILDVLPVSDRGQFVTPEILKIIHDKKDAALGVVAKLSVEDQTRLRETSPYASVKIRHSVLSQMVRGMVKAKLGNPNTRH
ncbi:MAG: hypothetical protein LBU87_03310 [Lactobacillales bacterium]|jgi:hypothetical protein|nr:hypothetical protein [Lactobacillales bacterium]